MIRFGIRFRTGQLASLETCLRVLHSASIAAAPDWWGFGDVIGDRHGSPAGQADVRRCSFRSDTVPSGSSAEVEFPNSEKPAANTG